MLAWLAGKSIRRGLLSGGNVADLSQGLQSLSSL